MVQRCRPQGRDPSQVVALWKAPGRGAREIRLEPGARGIPLIACADRATRRSTDWRWPVDNATDYFDVAVYQVLAAATGSGSAHSGAEPPGPPALDTDELTILTGWAERVTEALANAPERTLALLADARAGASWRAALGIQEPPPRVSDAIEDMAETIRASAPPDERPHFDAVLIAAHDEVPGEDQLASLARRILRSTLELHRVRQARDADSRGALVWLHLEADRRA
jgi:hypothetical protein